jgi:hypothetical protein
MCVKVADYLSLFKKSWSFVIKFDQMQLKKMNGKRSVKNIYPGGSPGGINFFDAFRGRINLFRD